MVFCCESGGDSVDARAWEQEEKLANLMWGVRLGPK